MADPPYGFTDVPAAGDLPKGHAILPHTPDVRIEAWARTAEECYEEAVAGFVGTFADVTWAPAGQRRPFHVGPGSPEALLLLLIDEVLLDVDFEGLVPRTARVEPPSGDGLDGVLDLVPFDEVEVTGSVARGVSYEGLLFDNQDGRWRCHATIEV